MNTKRVIQDEQTRAYIYRISGAIIPLLAAYGFIQEEQVALWMAVVTSILNVGLAVANTTTKIPSFTERAGMARVMYEAGLRGDQLTEALNTWEQGRQDDRRKKDR